MAGTTLVQCACKVGRGVGCVWGGGWRLFCAMQSWISGQEIAFHESYSRSTNNYNNNNNNNNNNNEAAPSA